jgi:hypothetical protein
MKALKGDGAVILRDRRGTANAEIPNVSEKANARNAGQSIVYLVRECNFDGLLTEAGNPAQPSAAVLHAVVCGSALKYA